MGWLADRSLRGDWWRSFLLSVYVFLFCCELNKYEQKILLLWNTICYIRLVCWQPGSSLRGVCMRWCSTCALEQKIDREWEGKLYPGTEPLTFSEKPCTTFMLQWPVRLVKRTGPPHTWQVRPLRCPSSTQLWSTSTLPIFILLTWLIAFLPFLFSSVFFVYVVSVWLSALGLMIIIRCPFRAERSKRGHMHKTQVIILKSWRWKEAWRLVLDFGCFSVPSDLLSIDLALMWWLEGIKALITHH